MNHIYDIKDFNFIENETAKSGNSRLNIYLSRFKYFIGFLMNKLKFPSFVRDYEFYDEIIGENFSVKTNRYFTIISIGNRDYYFNRLTGKFGGTGYQKKC